MFLEEISVTECCRLTFVSGDSQTGPRIGGCPPKNVFAPRQGGRYLLTLPIDQTSKLEMSIFLMVSEWDLFSYRWTIFNESDDHLAIVLHEESERDNLRVSEMILSPCRIRAGEVIADTMSLQDSEEPDRTDRYSGHKIGGRPYFMRKRQAFMDAVQRLEEEGARQLIQIDFPKRDDAIQGDWPFGDGLFNLFVKMDGANHHWYYFWQG